MGVSRVDFGGETLVDLTQDTVTPHSLLSGYSAHNKAGELIEGLAVIPTKVSELENDMNYLTENGNSSATTVTFEQAAQRANVQSGDSLEVAFAKLSKYCADLKTVAFSGAYGDLTGVPQSLKNPNALTFTGAVTGSYDGSAEESVAIPSVTNNDLANVPGTAWDAVRGAQIRKDVDKLNSDLQNYRIKYIEKNIQLNEITFVESQAGKYYYPLQLDIPQGAVLLGVSISRWGGLSENDNLFGYLTSNNGECGIASNVNSFYASAYVNLMFTYIV